MIGNKKFKKEVPNWIYCDCWLLDVSKDNLSLIGVKEVQEIEWCNEKGDLLVKWIS